MNDLKIILVGLILALIWLPKVACAQWWQWEPWQGELELGGEYNRETTSTGKEERRFQNIRFDERLRLRNRGFIFDPALLTFSGATTLGLLQDRSSTEGKGTSTLGRALGYSITGDLLTEKPYSLFTFANRSTDRITRDFGRSDIFSENLGSTLYLKYDLFPSRLGYRRELFEDAFRSLGLLTTRGEKRDTIFYSGNREWDFSSLDLDYQMSRVKDQFFSFLDHTDHRFDGRYRLEFGEELNKFFNSSLNYQARSGQTSFSSLSANQSLALEHSERLASSYSYAFNQAAAVGAQVTSHRGTSALNYKPLENLTSRFNLAGSLSSLPAGNQETISMSGGLTHQLYKSLTTSLDLRASLGFLPDGQQTSYGQGLSFGYTKQLPGEGRLSAGLGLAYDISDNRFENAERFVFQEKLAARFGVPAMLAQSRILSDTILVTDLTGSTVFRLGVDYILSPFGDFTEIIILPTGAIADGQTLLVSYRHIFSPSAKFSTLTWNYNVAADYKWINPYYSHQSTVPKLISGQDASLLEGETTDVLGLRLSWRNTKLNINLLNEYKKFDSPRLVYSLYQFSQFVGYIPTPTTSITFSSGQSFQNFTFPQREFTSYNGRVSFGWNPLFWPLSLTSFAGFRTFQGAVKATSYDLGLKITSSLTYGSTEISPWAEYNVTTWNQTTTRGFLMGVRVLRKF